MVTGCCCCNNIVISYSFLSSFTLYLYPICIIFFLQMLLTSYGGYEGGGSGGLVVFRLAVVLSYAGLLVLNGTGVHFLCF